MNLDESTWMLMSHNELLMFLMTLELAPFRGFQSELVQRWECPEFKPHRKSLLSEFTQKGQAILQNK